MISLNAEIEYIKGVGPKKGEVLRAELGVKYVRDLLFIYPFRYIDKTKFQSVKDLRSDGDIAMLKGTIVSVEKIKGKNRRVRLTALFKDPCGFIELVWFQKVKLIEDFITIGKEYTVYGRVSIYGGKKTITHPEFEEYKSKPELHTSLDPVYNSTEKLDKIGLDSRGRRRIIKPILDSLTAEHLKENLPEYIIKQLRLPSRVQTIKWIHFPKNEEEKTLAINRIKFEEFFFLQLQLLSKNSHRKNLLKGAVFESIGENFNHFYHHVLPFELTGAQKRVIKEIRKDLGAGYQMNRLLQGDVGSGKTIVALMTMLMAKDNGYQSCLMAPTEILAMQHYESMKEMLKDMKVNIAFLSGSVKGKRRKEILEQLEAGDIDIIIGTHALIESNVVFHKLGISITDEQHRFGVAQRASLWRKNDQIAPHILVMTATPIPRTLAMSMYGDLDVSVIDELPPGRKEIKTIHKTEYHRPAVIQFMHSEIKKGRQIYVVFPLIEESETLDLENLQMGYEKLLQYFPLPQYQISVVHGRMKTADKDYEMKRFVDKVTQIMVATTVIEVGVNVPNASVIIIENAERFGLSQLHQLRGRVGRGSDQSYCILMTGNKLSKQAKERISTMVRTNNGFEIAEADLQIRGPGEMEGTRQSGVNDFKLLSLAKDHKIMDAARYMAERLIEADSSIIKPEHEMVRRYLRYLNPGKEDWSRIS